MARRFLLYFMLFYFGASFVARAAQPGFLENASVRFEAPPEIVVGQPFTVQVVYKLPDNFYILQNSPFLKVLPQPHDAFSASPALFLSPTVGEGEAAKTVGEAAFSQQLTLNRLLSVKEKLSFAASYQLCNIEGLCYLPQTVELSYQPEIVAAAAPLFAKHLLFAFLGGILLNIMPCVLPVLSLKLYALSSLPQKARLSHALAHAGGVIAAFALLALLAALVKLSAGFAGWGLYWQNYGFVLFMALLLFVLALNLLGLYPILTPAGWSSSPSAPFFQGLLAAALGAPCSAPFLGAAAGFALSQSFLYLFVFFAAVGAGFVAPLFLLAALPQTGRPLQRLARAGIVFKLASAWILLALAGFLFSVLAAHGSVLRLGAAFWLAALGLWIYGKTVLGAHQRWGAAAAIAALAAAALIGLQAKSSAANQTAQAENVLWQPFSAESLAAAQQEGRPIFVSMGAAWCLTCQFNERTLLMRQQTADYFKQRNILWLKADFTHETPPQAAALMRKAGRAALPVYIFYDEQGRMRVLSELLSSAQLYSL